MEGVITTLRFLFARQAFHSSSGKQIEPRQNICRDEYKQANARES